MNDYFNDFTENTSGFLSGFSPTVRAAVFFAIPFIIADFFNYFSAGTALIITFPLLMIFYCGCGALAAKFSNESGAAGTPAYSGAIAGLWLWGVSLGVNTIIGLVLGTVTLGATLLLGLPYICICGPIQLIGGALLGAFGGFLYGMFGGKGAGPNNDSYDGYDLF